MDRSRCADFATLRLASRTSGMVVRMVRVPEPPGMSAPVAAIPSKTGFVRPSVLPAISDRLNWRLSEFCPTSCSLGDSTFWLRKARANCVTFLGAACALRQLRRQTHVILGFQAQQALLLRRRQLRG